VFAAIMGGFLWPQVVAQAQLTEARAIFNGINSPPARLFLSSKSPWR
jgi:hypothetical protein